MTIILSTCSLLPYVPEVLSNRHFTIADNCPLTYLSRRRRNYSTRLPLQRQSPLSPLRSWNRIASRVWDHFRSGPPAGESRTHAPTSSRAEVRDGASVPHSIGRRKSNGRIRRRSSIGTQRGPHSRNANFLGGKSQILSSPQLKESQIASPRNLQPHRRPTNRSSRQLVLAPLSPHPSTPEL